MYVNYFHMCHFYTHAFFKHPVFRRFDWLLQLDADAGLDRPVPCDPFDVLERGGKVFGFYAKELWHRAEANKLWRDRLDVPTSCPGGDHNNTSSYA